MQAARQGDWRLEALLIALIVVLALVSLMVGPAGLSPRAALAGLLDGEGPAGIIVRDIRLPRTLRWWGCCATPWPCPRGSARRRPPPPPPRS